MDSKSLTFSQFSEFPFLDNSKEEHINVDSFSTDVWEIDMNNNMDALKISEKRCLEAIMIPKSLGPYPAAKAHLHLQCNWLNYVHHT